MNFYIGIEGSPGVDFELRILSETDKAYQLDNRMGNVFWLPKSCFDDTGCLTEAGMKIYQEKVRS